MLKLQYDPLKDLQPMGLVVVVPHVLVVGSGVPALNVNELVVAMKARPNAYSYGSSGVGSTQHIAGEALNMAAGTKATHVPYKGSSAAHIDLIGGQIQLMLDTTSSAMAHIKSGKLRALAVTTPQRSPELPNVPTLAEAGLSGVEMTTWYGLFTTGGTPKPVVELLHAELKKALGLSDVQERLKGLGGQAGNLDLAAMAEFNRAEFERYGKLIKAAGIKAE
jgi:tripartite-type tricarboxylate transporter receptor subunit TctC